MDSLAIDQSVMIPWWDAKVSYTFRRLERRMLFLRIACACFPGTLFCLFLFPFVMGNFDSWLRL